jgi:hypothetical protein
MGTWDIRGSRRATAYRKLVLAALGSAIAFVLLMPVPASAQSGRAGGIAGQTAPAPGITSLVQGFVHLPLLVFLMTSSRETGCCA